MNVHSLSTPRRGARALALSLTSSLALGAPALAQDGGEIFQLPAITVTGEKLDRAIENTASSVTVITADEIADKNGANSIADAIEGVPNVLYTGTVGAPIIRGQDTQGPNYGSTAFFGGTIPRATINLDGHYLSYNEFVFGATSLWDVDRIEVFRGPQTASQGANSIAGAIIVNTKDPTFTPEGALQLQYGSRNMKRASLAVSGPLSDQVAARLALDSYGRDTFIAYTNPAFQRGGTDQDLSHQNARLKLLWQPTDLPGLEAKLTLSHTANNAPTWETASLPYDDLNNATGSMPSWKQRVNTAVGEIGYAFDNGLTLFNQMQYSNLHVDRVTEPVANGTAVIDQANGSNETRLSFGSADMVLNGVVGLYLARTSSDDTLYIRGVSDYDDEKTHLGLFTEMTYRPADRWRVTGGLRYQRDRIERSGSSPYAGAALAYDQSFSAWLPKLSVAYELTADTTLGALISRGYNPGGVNLSFASGSYITFEEETVWNYELFGRARLLNDRLTLTGNLFYSDFRDSQRLLPDYLNGVQYGSVVVNADEATSYGLELGMDYMVRHNLRIKAGAGLLQTDIGRFTNAGGTVYEGNEFGRAPGYMLSLAADWAITPKLRLSGDLRFTDGYYSTDENDPAYEVDNYAVANARLSYAARENLDIYAFVNNLFDERAATYLYDDRSVGGIVANMLEPRELGIGMTLTF